MKKKLLAIAMAIGGSASLAGPAQADMIAGWDFSQYLGAGALTTDGATVATTLNANYSDLDPTQGAGAESAAFGRMYADGSFGSSGPVTGVGDLVPNAGSLVSNVDAPGSLNFDALTVLTFEGQAFANRLKMNVQTALDLVFHADLSSVPGLEATDWVLDFGGQTLSGTSLVDVAFSTDGVNYTPLDTASLTANDELFSFSLGDLQASQAFVRLGFDSTGQALIDNVSIGATLASVPEPGVVALLASGLAGLAMVGRRRA